MRGAVELARLAVNKTIVPERKGRGRRSYGRQPAVRLFVYAQGDASRLLAEVQRSVKKVMVIYSALITMLAIALQALLQNKPELLRKIGVYRY